MRVSVKKFEGVFYRERKENFNGRPDKTFEVCWQEGGRKRWKTVGRLSQGVTAQDAARVRADIVSGKVPANPPAPKDPTVAELLEPKAGERWNPHAKRAAAALGKRKLSELTPSVLDGFVSARLKEGLSASYVRSLLNALSVAVNAAIKDRRWLGFNPLSKASGFRYPVPDNKGERWLSADEADRLLAALAVTSDLWHDMALVSHICPLS